MNIIFLDIDGVLNCELHYKKVYEQPENTDMEYLDKQICKERLGWIYDIVKECDAKIVISSTWRHDGLPRMKEIMQHFGFDPEAVIDITPSFMRDECVRGNEIAAWIKRNPELVGKYYEYQSYVIIDDDNDMLYTQRNNFFQTDTWAGLTPRLCSRITKFFNAFK